MSQNRANLIPTAVTDKNGRQTTVHKKPTTGATSAFTFPKASLSTSENDRRKLESDTADFLTNPTQPTHESMKYYMDIKRSSIMPLLAKYSEHTLRRFKTVPADFTRLLESTVYVSASEDHINDLIALAPVSTDMNSKVIKGIIHGFDDYPQLAPQDREHYPDQRTNQVQAIARVTNYLMEAGAGYKDDFSRYGKEMHIIKNEKLRDLIVNSDDPTAIADLILAREITDPEQFIELYETMSNAPKALSEGSL